MGVDGDLAGIIREIIQFLESLYDVDLPLKIENARVNLLQRYKTKLSTLSSSARGSNSPEPYLDMNAGKGLLLFSKKKSRDNEIEEYVGVEEQPERSAIVSHQDYYESFQEIDGTNNETSNASTECPRRSKSWRKTPPRDDRVENKLREIYKTFTPAKTTSKAHKSGSLYHKVDRKPFGFVRGNVKLCWIGLVGSHLLIYGSEDDKQPPEVCSIREYSARPAPNSVSRDPERAKSAFEIFSPGNKTLQFIARSTKEMEDWLAAINRTSMENQRDRAKDPEEDNVGKENFEESRIIEEKYQDVGEVISSMKHKDSPNSPMANPIAESDCEKFDTTRNTIILPSAPPPILPIRMIPRRLPSLPSEEIPVTSYEQLDDGYEEDDIYHKIEDFRDNGRSYENVKKSKNAKKLTKKKKRKIKEEIVKAETYDDVENKDLMKKKQQENTETYDDVRSMVHDIQISNVVDKKSTSSKRNPCDSLAEASGIGDQLLEGYEDVVQSSSSKIVHSCGKTKNSESKESKQTKPEKSPTKSSQKRSFLDRVRHRKDSPKKDEKIRCKEGGNERKPEKKDKAIISPECPVTMESRISVNTQLDLPTYDDVSELLVTSTNSQNENPRMTNFSVHTDEISNYNCPPPPRPIYAKPPSPIVVANVKITEEILFDEVYDDIGNYRDNGETISLDNNQRLINKSVLAEQVTTRDATNEITKKYENNCSVGNNCSIGASARISIIDEEETKHSLESEHYQIPRTDAVQVCQSVVEGQEKLYDDIAILADFRARQRDSSATSSSNKKLISSAIIDGAEKISISTKKSWNRFGSGKKIPSRVSTPQTSATKNKSLLDVDDLSVNNIIPVGEKHEGIKLNKLQKLINKMESTLGKQPSTKPVTPILNKTHNAE